MKDTLKNLIAKAVEDNVLFTGSIGSNYTIQDLIHVTSLQSINTLFQATKKQLGALETDSLFKTANTAKSKVLNFQSEVLREVFEYRQELAEAQKTAKEAREAKAEKLKTLKNLKSVKELEKLGNMSLEEIEKEIATIE